MTKTLTMADIIGSEDREKSLYCIQIRYLDEQLERRQLECDELTKQNKNLASLYIALEIDHKDINVYLKSCVVAKEKEVDELAERLQSQQQAAEQDRETLQLQHSQQLQEKIHELSSENSMLAIEETKQHQEPEEQLVQLMQQQSEMESLKKQLVSQREEHKAAIDSLKTEAESRRQKMSEEMQSRADNYIEAETSNIIQERAEHSEVREKVQVLLNKNMVLRNEKRDLRDQNEVLCLMDNRKKKINMVTQKILKSKKEVEQLTKKCQQVKVKHGSTTYKSLLAEKEALRQRLVSASEECHQKTAEADSLRVELQRESSRRRQLEGIMQEAVSILSHILTVPEKTERQRLLELLQSAAPRGAGSTPEESSPGPRPQTSALEPVRAQTLKLSTDPLFLMARYRRGDLGLVPRPMWKHQPVSSRTRVHPEASQQETLQSEDIAL
ncbi:LOW QUALITY PROTEIN: cilia- and flagella-associated protein 157-like [Cottoperca gobio]|uniref:Cilia- and flagella-associated protein 157 n=1 Tax=Cottoperca gobio TaxID=56716 RepID=A0A6J2QCW8_COTGO|nr:LOW QUALITY PROTEIN: cilia- and flagella-associated protein 157-like [Cottoperca gobio]